DSNNRNAWLRYDLKTATVEITLGDGTSRKYQDELVEISINKRSRISMHTPGEGKPYILTPKAESGEYIRKFIQLRQRGRDNQAHYTEGKHFGPIADLPVLRDCVLIIVEDSENRRKANAKICEIYGVPYILCSYMEEAIEERANLPRRMRVAFDVDLGGTAYGGWIKALDLKSEPSPNTTEPGPTLDIETFIARRWPKDRIIQCSRLFGGKALQYALSHRFDHICIRDVDPDIMGSQFRSVLSGHDETSCTTKTAQNSVLFIAEKGIDNTMDGITMMS
ncbi:MAG: hypothetical protein ACFFBS_08655, partial [Promethearchaeota archaeon]